MDIGPSPPVEPNEPDPYEGYQSDAVGKDPHKKDPQQEPSKKNGALAIFVASMIQKSIDAILKNPKEDKKTSLSSFQKDLSELKMAFERLKKGDWSGDTTFLNQLSSVWQHLFENIPNAKQNPSFKALLQSIQSYPPNEPHSFGYYLTECAGQKWVPFPYMEMIEKMHLDYQKDSASSVLTEWTRLIDSLLQSE